MRFSFFNLLPLYPIEGSDTFQACEKRFSSRLFPDPNPLACCRLADNTYVGTFGNEGWGAKANDILSKVRGKDFRHEKTKKKRGSYRGGAIDTNAASASIRFAEDE